MTLAALATFVDAYKALLPWNIKLAPAMRSMIVMRHGPCKGRHCGLARHMAGTTVILSASGQGSPLPWHTTYKWSRPSTSRDERIEGVTLGERVNLNSKPRRRPSRRISKMWSCRPASGRARSPRESPPNCERVDQDELGAGSLRAHFTVKYRTNNPIIHGLIHSSAARMDRRARLNFSGANLTLALASQFSLGTIDV